MSAYLKVGGNKRTKKKSYKNFWHWPLVIDFEAQYDERDNIDLMKIFWPNQAKQTKGVIFKLGPRSMIQWNSIELIESI